MESSFSSNDQNDKLPKLRMEWTFPIIVLLSGPVFLYPSFIVFGDTPWPDSLWKALLAHAAAVFFYCFCYIVIADSRVRDGGTIGLLIVLTLLPVVDRAKQFVKNKIAEEQNQQGEHSEPEQLRPLFK